MPEDSRGDSQAEELNDVEISILLTLNRLGGKCLQKDLWKMAGTNSKVGMPALNHLLKLKLVSRRKVGEKLYEIRLTQKGARLVSKISAKMAIIPGEDIELLTSIPCFYCPHIFECGPGHENSPETCELLGGWLLSIAKHRGALGG